MIQVYASFHAEWLQTFWAGERRILIDVPGLGNAQIDRNERKIKLAHKWEKLGRECAPINTQHIVKVRSKISIRTRVIEV